ncbi:unnamed protein product [Rhizoctonia solani]|uniref:NACHT domain-containing protein n=1 Tax=Rhizoctonia solani TaxID=456999 RepID=A0A8H3HWW1_9AGAM|nr:unnamed protein product [Rhizoctonia solani]
MLLRLKESAKRRLRIGTQPKDHALDALSPDDPSSVPTAVPASALHPSPVAPSFTTGIVQNPNWNSSASSLPLLTFTTGQPLAPNTTDDNTRPALDNRNTTVKAKTRPGAYLWSGLKSLWGILDSSSERFGPLRSAIGELKWWIDLYESTTKNNKDYNELRIKLDSLLGDLSTFISRPTTSAMLPHLITLGSGIQCELELILQKQGVSSTQRFLEVMEGSDEVPSCYQRINSHLERFMFNANLTIWETVDQQATDALIGRISFAPSAMYNAAEAIDVKRGSCAPKTRQTELEKLGEWAHRSQAHNVYWLNGMAGTGKTTIAYSLCAELDNHRKLGASFFCSRMLPECRNVKHILPSVAYQLASFSPPFRYALSQVLKSDRDVHNRILKGQLESLIIKPLLAAKHTLLFDIVVVIDALDECENENSVGRILDLLLENDLFLSLPIRFLISSRPEPEIYRRMMKRVGEGFDARLVLHELDYSAVKNDIKAYLTYELDDIQLTPTHIDGLVERSGILFIYAATAAAYIKAGYLLMEHEERLDMILDVSLPSSGRMDNYIDELYNTILRAAFNNTALDKPSQERMGNILNAVICAQEPMTTCALAGLLKLKSGEQVAALLRPLGSVLHVSEKSGLITVLHTSFHDFLLDEQRSTVYYCNLRHNNTILAKACLGIIKHHNPQFNICHIETSYYPDEEIPDIDKRIDSAISSELFYSCRHWANHVQLADEPHELADLVHDFLSRRFLLWIEVLNLKKCVRLGMSVMQNIENWGRVSSHTCSVTIRELTYTQHAKISDELVELAHDAWRFVTMFASHSVSRSTPHIYISMLPFWPAEGPISFHYTPRMQNLIKPTGTALTRRQTALLATWAFGNQISSTKFSPDGSRIGVAAGKELFIIDGYTGQGLVGPLNGHTNTISSVEFSPNGLHVATSSWDGTIRVWDTQTGRTSIGPLKGHALSVESIHFSPDGTRVVSGSWDTTLRVWDITTGRMLMDPLEGHIAFVNSVVFSPDGSLIASGSSDKTIRLWEAESGALKVEPLRGHPTGVNSIVFSPDGSYLASGSRGGSIKLWDVERGLECDILIESGRAAVTAIQFSLDGRRILSASEDKIIRIHNLESGAIVNSLNGHTNHVTSVMFSQDEARILSGSSDNTVRVWDAKSNSITSGSPPPDGHHSEVNMVQYLSGDTYIASRSIDGTVRSWHPETGEISNAFHMHKKFSREHICMAFSGNGNIASGSRFGAIDLYPTCLTLTGHRGAISALAWSPDGDYIASGSGGAMQLWDTRTRRRIFDQLTTSPNPVTSVGFSPNGRIIAATSGNIITVWELEIDKGQNNQKTLEGHTRFTTSTAFSSDNELIASGSKDATVRIWSNQTGKTIFGPFRGARAEVTSVAFSPDGARIASASRDMRIYLWDFHSSDMLFESLEGHAGAVLSVAFSQNGTRIVSGSSDCTIRIWASMSGATNQLTDWKAECTSWSLTLEGWIHDSQGRPLIWVPPDLRTSLLRPQNTTIVSSDGWLKLGFSSAIVGNTSCFSRLTLT